MDNRPWAVVAGGDAGRLPHPPNNKERMPIVARRCRGVVMGVDARLGHRGGGASFGGPPDSALLFSSVSRIWVINSWAA